MTRSSHIASILTLMASSSTLFCCALPALFVMLGAGATLAGFMSSVPQLSLLSLHKATLFTVSGGILLANGVWQYRQRHAACPTDPAMARACGRARRVSLVIYGVSLTMYLIGVSFAFIIPRVMEMLP